jgi:hypothetical protein
MAERRSVEPVVAGSTPVIHPVTKNGEGCDWPSPFCRENRVPLAPKRPWRHGWSRVGRGRQSIDRWYTLRTLLDRVGQTVSSRPASLKIPWEARTVTLVGASSSSSLRPYRSASTSMFDSDRRGSWAHHRKPGTPRLVSQPESHSRRSACTGYPAPAKCTCELARGTLRLWLA